MDAQVADRIRGGVEAKGRPLTSLDPARQVARAGEALVAKVLLIESRDPFDHAQVGRGYELAGGLLAQRDEVTYFLLENGVLPARRCSRSAPLGELAKRGARVLADELSLRERGIDRNRLADGVQAAELDEVVELLSQGCKAIWL
jgi:hypothetical protein